MTTTVETEAEIVTETKVALPELVVADRCDAGRCGAQAFVITQHKTGVLLWCKHHAEAHMESLWDCIIVDKRGEINKKPGGSA